VVQNILIEKLGIPFEIKPYTGALVGLRKAIPAAVLVMLSAWSNKQSLGAHYHE
jgi:hypothetical protein